MKHISDDREPESLYELSWNNAQDSTFAVDTGAGIVVDVNPAAETLMGYSEDVPRVVESGGRRLG